MRSQLKAGHETEPGAHWLRSGAILALATLLLAGCNPTVRVEQEKPFEINMNINIQHDIRVRVDKELDEILSEDSGLF